MSALAASLLLSAATLAAPLPSGSAFWKPGWDEPSDPDRDCTFARSKGELTITVPGGDHCFLTERGKMNAPRLVRDFKGSFTLAARVSLRRPPSALAAARVAGGLVVFGPGPADPIVHVEFARTGAAAPVRYLAVYLRLPGAKGRGTMTCDSRMPGWPVSADSDTMHVRLERLGRMFRVCLSDDGRRWYWMSGGFGVGRLPEQVKVGLFASSSSSDVSEVRFDRFRLVPVADGVKFHPDSPRVFDD
ncbi:MAG: hypothetical protein ACRC33_06115 [Gemmataceae bacterium]